MTFSFFTSEPLEYGLRRILCDQLALSVQWLTAPGEGAQFDTSVHEARKNGKRLRALLRLARPLLPPAVYTAENQLFRDTSRRIAPLRDSWVMVETLDKLRVEVAQPEAWAGIRTQLVAHYEATRAQFVADTAVLSSVAADLQAAHGRLQTLTLAVSTEALLMEGLRRTYRMGQLLMTAAYDQQDPHLFHEWRKQVKYNWHQLELLEPIWPVLLRETAEAHHTLSTLLGDAHDLVVLRETIALAAEQYSGQPDLLDLLAHINKRQAALEKMARPLGQRLYTEPSHALATRLGVYWHTWRAGEAG